MIAATLVVAIASCGDDDDTASPTEPDVVATTATVDATTTPTVATASSSVVATTAASAVPTTEATDELAPRPLPEPTTLKVAIPVPLEAFADLLIGVETGEYEKENLTVEIEYVPVQEGLVLLDQGTVDITQSAMQAGVLNLVAGGSNLKWTFPIGGNAPDSQQGYFVNDGFFGGDGLQGEELKGQRILTPSGVGSVSAWYLWDYLEGAGLREGLAASDLKFEAFAPTDAPIAIKGGTVGIGLVVTPFQAELIDDPCCSYLDGAFREGANAGWLFGANLLEGEHAVGEAFVRATARVWRDYLQPGYHSDPETLELLSTVLEVPADAIAGLPELWWDLSFDMQVSNLGAQEFWFEYGGVLSYTEPLEEDDVYDHSYLEAVTGDG